MPASTVASAALRPRLSPAQVGEFCREGFLTIREPVLPAERFAALCRHFDQMLAELPPQVRPENMDVPHFMDTALFAWLFDDAVLDLVEPLLGPDIALFSSHFLCKPGGDGKRVPWHEDSAYWSDMLAPMEVVTVWLALDRSDRDNGCMRVIPRTHHNGYSTYEPVPDPANQVFDREIRKQDYDASKAVDLVLDPNQASLHDGKLMHGSNRNSSAHRRCGYTMRYVSTRTRLHPRCEAHHHLYLARGRDHAGNTYGDPSRTYAQKLESRGIFVKKGH